MFRLPFGFYFLHVSTLNTQAWQRQAGNGGHEAHQKRVWRVLPAHELIQIQVARHMFVLHEVTTFKWLQQDPFVHGRMYGICGDSIGGVSRKTRVM